MKFQVKITGWGDDALEFLNPACNFIIMFNEDAPPELADISVLHTKCELKEDPAPGDTMTKRKKRGLIAGLIVAGAVATAVLVIIFGFKTKK